MHAILNSLSFLPSRIHPHPKHRLTTHAANRPTAFAGFSTPKQECATPDGREALNAGQGAQVKVATSPSSTLVGGGVSNASGPLRFLRSLSNEIVMPRSISNEILLPATLLPGLTNIGSPPSPNPA